jgi:hypothetical protein
VKLTWVAKAGNRRINTTDTEVPRAQYWRREQARSGRVAGFSQSHAGKARLELAKFGDKNQSLRQQFCDWVMEN